MNKRPNQMQRIMIAMEKAGAVRRDGKSTEVELGIKKYQTAEYIGLRKAVAPVWPDAVEHAHADKRCGREWVCACGACNIIRREIKRLDDNACMGARGWTSNKAESMKSVLAGV